jgi:pyruvate-formate lyase-activating enzyme
LNKINDKKEDGTLENHNLRKKDLYRLPWSLNDNPVGWVEITDKCNISCKGCYRSNLVGHKSLEEIKEEILFLEEWRNICNVHLAGGEPLIHPEIVDIVRFIHKRGLNPVIISNGHRLEKELLTELKNAGLAEISFHVDSEQVRKGWTGKNEKELNELRQNYVNMLWGVGSVNCNFNMTVSPKNINYIPDIIRWALCNKGKVSGLTFITLRGYHKEGFKYIGGDKTIDINSDSIGMVNDVENELIHLSSKDIYKLIKSYFPFYEPSSYLGGTITPNSFKWLISNVICCDEDIVESVSPKIVEAVQSFYHLFYRKYFIGGRSNPGKEILLLAFFDKQIRRALISFLLNPRNIKKKLYTLTIGIIQPSELLPDGQYEMCDSCPDVTYYKGRLVHSCRLDEYRLYGKPIIPVIEKINDKLAN